MGATHRRSAATPRPLLGRGGVYVLLLVGVAVALGVIDFKAWMAPASQPAPLPLPVAPLVDVPDPSPAPPVKTGEAAAAVTAVDQYARKLRDTTVGVAVFDRRTGEFAIGSSGDAPIYSASLIKLIVVVDVLERRHTGLPVDARDEEIMRSALGVSDDDAMSDLWVRFDGAGGVNRVARQLGLTQTMPASDNAQWGESLTSAGDFVRVFQFVLSGLPPPDRDFVLSSLESAPAEGAGGFDQNFGLVATPRKSGEYVAVKQGWMCCQDGKTTLHSGGTIGSQRFVIALMSAQPSSLGYGRARSVLTEAADRVLNELDE